jgi:tRNA (guanine37-N1)-methyltransferase
MDVYVVALFPEMLRAFFASGVIGRAVTDGTLRVHDVQIRDFSTNKHHTVDDTPYGGGSGMVMMAPPVVRAMESVDPRENTPTEGEGTETAEQTSAPRARRILMSPAGKPFRHEDAVRLAKEPALMFVCGRYEGVDERVMPYIDEELSLGDFVLSGGEVAAAVMIDAIARLIPGVLGNHESLDSESHAGAGLLEYPHYTRPAEFRGAGVPGVLVSGDHARIAKWRRWQSLRRTAARRPDVLARLELSPADKRLLEGDEP